MVRDLNFPVEVVASPTVRESDGLAASSRNAYLTAEERALAPQIHAAMQASATKLKDPVAIVRALVRSLEKIPGARLDYAEAVDAVTLMPLKNRKSAGRLAAAVFLGKARLIDNIPLPPLT
jgi:pantoate--beta-alanine ligase